MTRIEDTVDNVIEEYASLSTSDIQALGNLFDAVVRRDKIKWLSHTDGENICEGTLRSFCDEEFGMASINVRDIRDAYVWITGVSGLIEHLVPVRHIMKMHNEGGVAYGQNAG